MRRQNEKLTEPHRLDRWQRNPRMIAPGLRKIKKPAACAAIPQPVMLTRLFGEGTQ